VLDLLQEEEAGNDEPPYNGREEGLRYRDWVADTFFKSLNRQNDVFPAILY